MASPKRCKDCLPESKRPAPHPGPRCATHHRARRKQISAQAHDRYVQQTYGLNEGEYNRLYEGQGQQCPICLRAKGKTKRLAVDHDHKTGEVRGLLDASCNSMLAHARDDIEMFERAIEYLRNPPARAILGG